MKLIVKPQRSSNSRDVDCMGLHQIDEPLDLNVDEHLNWVSIRADNQSIINYYGDTSYELK